MGFQEVELKLRLNRESYEFFIQNHAAVWTREQHNFFLDTEDFDLLKTKWVFRLRKENENAYMTLKGPATQIEGVYSRPEYEEKIEAFIFEELQKGFFIHTIDLGVLEKAPINWPKKKLKIYADFFNTRTRINWMNYPLELDCFHIGEKLFYEMECETEAEKLDALSKELKDYFSAKGFNFDFSAKSKFLILLDTLDIKI